MSRKLGVAMKKGEMDDFRKKVESAKTTMQLANQIYYQAVQNQRWEILERDVMDLRASHQRNHSIIESEVAHIRNFKMRDSSPSGQSPQKLLGCVDAVEVEEEGRDEDVIESADVQNGVHPRRNIRQQSRPKNQASMNFASGLLSIAISADEHNTATSVSFGLPKWIYARKFELRMMKSQQGWDQSIRSYRMVSYNAKVFDYCMDGNVAGLQQLFTSGQASPFEVDPDGRTPLHYSALYARPEVCKFLFEHGADANVRTCWQGKLCLAIWKVSNGKGRYPNQHYIPSGEPFRGWPAYSTPLHLLLNTGHVLTQDRRKALRRENCQPSCETRIVQGFKRTIEALMVFGADTMLEDQHSQTAFHKYTGPSSSFGWFARENVWDIKTMSQHDHLGMIVSQMLNYTTNVGEIVRHFATEETMQTLAHVLYDGVYLLNVFIPSWLFALRANFLTLLSWESLLLDLIHAGAGVHIVSGASGDGYSCLWFMLAAIVKRPIDTYPLQKWLELLDRAGVDLVEYGRIENEIYDNYETEWTFWYNIEENDGHQNNCCLELLELRIGETPEDFYIEFKDLYASNPWVADFWDWAEAHSDEEKIKAIPGSWQDD